jgi:hypothetical protein
MRFVTLCLGGAILVGSVFPASAQSKMHNTDIVSGTGGGLFEDFCHGSDVLIGFNYSAGKAMNQIAGVCQAQHAGALIGANYGLATHGTAPDYGGVFVTFTDGGALRCNGRQAINQLHVFLDSNGQVNKVEALCIGLLPSERLIPSTLPASSGGGPPVSDKLLTCGPDEVAIGLIGRSGTLIDGLGLRCATFFVKVTADVDVYDVPDPPDGDNRKGVLTAGKIQVTLKKKGAPDHPNWYQVGWPGDPAGDNWVYSATPPDFQSLDPDTLHLAP